MFQSCFHLLLCLTIMREVGDLQVNLCHVYDDGNGDDDDF